MSMTREKAIEYLEWVRPKKPYTQDKKNVQEAIDMGIEALKETERNPTITSWHDFDRGYNIAKEKFNRPHGECNQCRYYDGVRGVPGHAPCWHWNIGGVMWNDYCSRFEEERER